MYRVGQKEIDRIAKVLLSGRLFRYGELGGQCRTFERRFAKYLGVKHTRMTASGSQALTAALIGLRVGPGDEVILPAHTYMASATAVLSVGAIPVVCDIDESLTLCPKALDKIIRKRTKAVMPVHMWGLPCDMKAIMKVAKKRGLLVVEDVCQAVGGGYEGKMLGSFGQANAFSFNYYKNISCGEGGAVVCAEDAVMERAGYVPDSFRFYWEEGEKRDEYFAFSGARASELSGAMMNVQLDRLPGMLRAMRRQKKRILEATADTGLQPIKANSPDWECASRVGFLLPSAEAAEAFGIGVIAARTSRHNYTDWDPVLSKQGAHHPALNPYRLKENKACRKDTAPDACARSLDILNRAVLINLHPDHKAADTRNLIQRIRTAARRVL